MSSGVATRSLFKNVWFLTSSGFKYGYVFLYGSRVEDAAEGEPAPEYELAELLYDFEGNAIVAHGYSVLVDLVEYVFRGMQNIDLSIFTREELRKLTKIGVVNAYINGVTLPFARTKHPEVVIDIARENSMRIGVIAERGVVSKNPFTVILEVDGDRVYYDDKKIGIYDSVICKPIRVSEKCVLIDSIGYGNLTTAIELVYRETGSPDFSFRILTNMYRISDIDNGYVEKGAASDLIIYDLKNPLKAIPISSAQSAYSLLTRSMQPDIVFIGGDVFYEFGENLAIPIVKVNELLKKVAYAKPTGFESHPS